MKRSTKILSALLSLLLLLSFAVSCAESGSSPKDTDPVTDAATDPVIDKYELTVAGKPLSDFRIVYAEAPYSEKEIKHFEESEEEYDFFYLTALSLSDRIFAMTGVRLPLSSEENDPVDCEILVGPTNRPESEGVKDMDVYDYEIAVKNGKLVVAAGYIASEYVNKIKLTYCFATTYHAWDYAEKAIRAAKQVKYDFAEGSALTGSAAAAITTVAMIGDSITDMAYTTAVPYNYPSCLGRCLWQDFLILNYGISGKTMRSDLADAYTKSNGYTAAEQHCDIFDVVVMMLGTNDSNRDREWTEEDDDAFIDGCMEILDSVVVDDDSVKTVVCTSPAYYGKDNFTSDDVLYLEEEMQKTLTAAGYGNVSTFDMYTYTDDVLTVARYPDKLHPDEEGCLLMAQGIAEYLKELVK
ncbi:MAG: GDSL-type esterase/lipase family protein [Lachnospiraceae bacterium]|nr:GDSL-type esterase/lipase family protein [Lachnospiraceae bacterium]